MPSGIISFCGPSPSLPQSASIVTHFDANTIGGSDNSTVSSWTDSVGGIVAGTTVGTAPVLKTNRIGSYPSVQFGGAHGLSISTPGALKTTIDTQEYTVFIVFRTLGSATGGSLFCAAAAGGDTFRYVADGTNVSKQTAFAAVPHTGTSFSTFGSTAWNSTASYSSTGQFQAFYINGGAVGTSVTAAAGTGGNTIAIGNNAGNNFPVNAEIFNIIVWNRPLLPWEYMQAERWARNRYSQALPWAGLAAFNVFFGDSIMAGVGSTASTKTPAYLAAQSLGLSYGQWHCLAVGGITTANMGALASNWVDPLPSYLRMKTNLVGFEWYNQEAVSGHPGAFNAAQTYLANRRAITNQRIVWGTSTGYNGDPSSDRNSYNAAFDGTIPNSNIDSYMALHNDSQIGTSSAFANHAANWSDGIHLSDAGYVFLAADMVTAIQALP